MAVYAAQMEVREQTSAKELAGIFHRQTSLLRAVCDSQAGRIGSNYLMLVFTTVHFSKSL